MSETYNNDNQEQPYVIKTKYIFVVLKNVNNIIIKRHTTHLHHEYWFVNENKRQYVVIVERAG